MPFRVVGLARPPHPLIMSAEEDLLLVVAVYVLSSPFLTPLSYSPFSLSPSPRLVTIAATSLLVIPSLTLIWRSTQSSAGSQAPLFSGLSGQKRTSSDTAADARRASYAEMKPGSGGLLGGLWTRYVCLAAFVVVIGEILGLDGRVCEYLVTDPS